MREEVRKEDKRQSCKKAVSMRKWLYKKNKLVEYNKMVRQ